MGAGLSIVAENAGKNGGKTGFAGLKGAEDKMVWELDGESVLFYGVRAEKQSVWAHGCGAKRGVGSAALLKGVLAGKK